MTIKQIAEEANVSPAAVSRFFNGGSLAKEKSERIRLIVEKYNYQPNAMAQTMRTGKSGQIGVIVPQIHSDSLSQIMSGIAGRLHESDYTFILGCSENNVEKEIQYIKTMQCNKMEGIILMGTVMTPHLRTTIDKCKIPIVVTGQCFDGVPCVFYDDINAMKDIAAIMIRKRKHIAYIGVNENDEAVGKKRRLGVQKAMEEAGRDKTDLVIVQSDFTFKGGFNAMKELLNIAPDTDGVVCATDLIAHGAIRAARDAGRNIPDDISFAGVGNCWADIAAEPQLATVQMYFEECGSKAVDLLQEMIDKGKNDFPVSRIMLGYSVIERGSI